MLESPKKDNCLQSVRKKGRPKDDLEGVYVGRSGQDEDVLRGGEANFSEDDPWSEGLPKRSSNVVFMPFDIYVTGNVSSIYKIH